MHFYGSSRIDRAAHLRGDAEWLESALRDPQTRIVPVWRDRSLLHVGDAPRACLLSGAALSTLGDAGQPVLMGLDETERAYFAVALTGAESPLDQMGATGSRFADLRKFGPLLSAGDAGLLAYARAIAHWHATHRYCGACAHPTVASEAGWLRVCDNPDCGRQHFPRTDPAIIVRVLHDDRILLGRQAAWPERWYSVLAGFVEPGESLEDTVRREVAEETGVRVGAVQYLSSQPWPFPASLMLGFAAEALTDRIELGTDELEDARWFSRREIDEGVAAGQLRLSPEVSISRHLIETWRQP